MIGTQMSCQPTIQPSADLADVLRSMYAQNTNCAEAFGWRLHESVEDCLSIISKSPPKELTLKSLDDFELANPDAARFLQYLVAFAPHKELVETFGKDILLWTWAQGVYLRKDIENSVVSLTNKNLDLLERARLYAWRVLCTCDAMQVMQTYDLFSSLPDTLAKINLPDLLHGNKLQKIKLSDEMIAKYLLSFVRTKGDYESGREERWGDHNVVGNRTFAIWMDAPVGIALMYEGQPSAVVSFAPKSLDTLMIHQLQGVQPRIIEHYKFVGSIRTRGLSQLDWRKLLVECAEHVAKTQGFKELAVQGAHNNYWIKPRQGEAKAHLSLNEAVLKYNKQAERLGFKQREDKNWYKVLN